MKRPQFSKTDQGVTASGIDPSLIDFRKDDLSAETAKERMRSMVEHLKAGGTLPPIHLRHKAEGRFDLLEGNARVMAYRELGLHVPEAELYGDEINPSSGTPKRLQELPDEDEPIGGGGSAIGGSSEPSMTQTAGMLSEPLPLEEVPPTAEAWRSRQEDEPSRLAEFAGETVDLTGGASAAPESPAKKKATTRSQTGGGGGFDWKHATNFGGLFESIGRRHDIGPLASAGSMLKTVGQIGGFAAQVGPLSEAGEAGGGGELGGALADMASSTQGSESRQQTEGREDISGNLKDLIEAVKKLTEVMERRHGQPGPTGDHMPEGGSFGGAAGSGVGALGGIGEALGLSPGEIQLILTMIRAGMMTAP